MKVCVICKNRLGGFKSFVDNLCCVLKKNGVQITILYIGNGAPDISGVDLVMEDIGNKRFRIKLSGLLFLILQFIRKCYKKAIAVLRRRDRKAVLKYNIFGSQYTSAQMIERLDFVMDLSNFDAVISSEEVTCNYFLSKNIVAKNKIGYVHPDYIMASFDRVIDKRYFRDLDYICAVSQTNAESLAIAHPYFKQKIKGIRNPIDVCSILDKANAYIPLEFSDKVFNIITVCRLDNTSKALDRLLLIAKSLKEKGLNFVWRIIGDGPYREVMERTINEFNIEDRIILLGHLDNPIPYVEKSSLFVLQSYYEGFPISVCESLIVNTPALVTNFPSSHELIENEITGFIVKNDYFSILDALLDIVQNNKRVEQIRKNLINIDKSHFEKIDSLLNIIGG